MPTTTTVTTANLKTALQDLFDTSGGVFYKENTNEPILIVNPNGEETNKPWLNDNLLINLTIVFFIIAITFSFLATRIIRTFFIEPIHDLKIYPAYNLAPSAIIFLTFTVINTAIMAIAGIKIHRAFFIWMAGYLIIQLGLLMKTTYKFPVKSNYYHFFHDIKTILGINRNLPVFLMKIFMLIMLIVGFYLLFGVIGTSDYIVQFTSIAVILSVCFPLILLRSYVNI